MKLIQGKKRTPRSAEVVCELNGDAETFATASLDLEANIWQQISVEKEIIVRVLCLMWREFGFAVIGQTLRLECCSQFRVFQVIGSKKVVVALAGLALLALSVQQNEVDAFHDVRVGVAAVARVFALAKALLAFRVASGAFVFGVRLPQNALETKRRELVKHNIQEMSIIAN